MFYRHLSFCPQGTMYHPPTVLLASGWYASYCNAVLFKLGLNCEMYSWVAQFLNYFISISERHRDREARGGGGIVVKVFVYLFFYVNNFCKQFFVNSFLYSFLSSSLLNARFHFHLIHPHLIIQCKASFSSHFISFFLFFVCK